MYDSVEKTPLQNGNIHTSTYTFQLSLRYKQSTISDPPPAKKADKHLGGFLSLQNYPKTVVWAATVSELPRIKELSLFLSKHGPNDRVWPTAESRLWPHLGADRGSRKDIITHIWSTASSVVWHTPLHFSTPCAFVVIHTLDVCVRMCTDLLFSWLLNCIVTDPLIKEKNPYRNRLNQFTAVLVCATG